MEPFSQRQIQSGAGQSKRGLGSLIPSATIQGNVLYRAEFVDFGKGMEVLAELTEVPCTGMEVIQNSQKFRVLNGSLAKLTEVPGGYIMLCPYPYPHPGILQRVGYRVLIPVFILHNGRVRVWDVVPVPRVLWHGRTELEKVSGTGMNVRCKYRTELREVPGTGMNAVRAEFTKLRSRGINIEQNSHNFFVR